MTTATDTRGPDDAGLPALHQGDPGADLGGDHQARARRQAYFHGCAPRRRARAPAAAGARARPTTRSSGSTPRCSSSTRRAGSSHGWRVALRRRSCADEPESRVTWEIEPQEGGYSLLTVVHDRLEDAPKTAASVSGHGLDARAQRAQDAARDRRPLRPRTSRGDDTLRRQTWPFETRPERAATAGGIGGDRIVWVSANPPIAAEPRRPRCRPPLPVGDLGRGGSRGSRHRRR